MLFAREHHGTSPGTLSSRSLVAAASETAKAGTWSARAAIGASVAGFPDRAHSTRGVVRPRALPAVAQAGHDDGTTMAKSSLGWISFTPAAGSVSQRRPHPGRACDGPLDAVPPGGAARRHSVTKSDARRPLKHSQRHSARRSHLVTLWATAAAPDRAGAEVTPSESFSPRARGSSSTRRSSPRSSPRHAATRSRGAARHRRCRDDEPLHPHSGQRRHARGAGRRGRADRRPSHSSPRSVLSLAPPRPPS